MIYFNSLNLYFKFLFGCRVYKIIIDIGGSCPNRDSSGFGGCIYCNSKGSGSNLYKRGICITKQITNNVKSLKRRYKAENFIAYFQSFSNTYTMLIKIEQFCNICFSINNILGIAISTRPDCVDIFKLDLIEYYSRKRLVWIEFGLQSSHLETLNFINRGHDIGSFKRVIKMIRNREISVCVHVILGLICENRKSMLSTADFLSNIGIDSIKIHFLCILKGTLIEKMFRFENFGFLNMFEYTSVLSNFIERLSLDIVIQRINSDVTNDEIISPIWVLKKRRIFFLVYYFFRLRNLYQGENFFYYFLPFNNFL